MSANQHGHPRIHERSNSFEATGISPAHFSNGLWSPRLNSLVGQISAFLNSQKKTLDDADFQWHIMVVVIDHLAECSFIRKKHGEICSYSISFVESETGGRRFMILRTYMQDSLTDRHSTHQPPHISRNGKGA